MDSLSTGAEGAASDGTAFEPAQRLAELKALAQQASPAERPSSLPVKAIKRAPELFQPRRRKEDERHVQELARAVGRVGVLDPLLVMQIGPDPYLIDGHHRLAAYEGAEVTEPIPVEYFQGTVEEAVLAAGRGNSKAKLPMQSDERQNYAWRLVLLGGYSKAQTVAAAGVSDGTVAAMRRVQKALGAAAYECKSWWEARQRAEGQGQQWSDEERQTWREERAAWLVDQIVKACGPKLTDDVEIAAAALERLFGRNLDELVHYLGYVPKDRLNADPGEGDF
jgi:ParB-like chromosome segregation protein Spo0J